MQRKKYTIKNGEIIITNTIKIDDYSILLRYNMNLYCLAGDIRRSRNDEYFENYLLKAEELFAEDIEKAKVVKNPVFGNHSIFYYMYGHTNDWVRYTEKQLIEANAILAAVKQVGETVKIIRNSKTLADATKNLMDLLGLDEIGAKFIVDLSLSRLTGFTPDNAKENIDYLEKRLAAVKELAKYDK